MKIKITFADNSVRYIAEDNDGLCFTNVKDHHLIKSFTNNSSAILQVGIIAGDLAELADSNSDNEISKIEFVN